MSWDYTPAGGGAGGGADGSAGMVFSKQDLGFDPPVYDSGGQR